MNRAYKREKKIYMSTKYFQFSFEVPVAIHRITDDKINYLKIQTSINQDIAICFVQVVNVLTFFKAFALI